jgi:hypothetical protein
MLNQVQSFNTVTYSEKVPPSVPKAYSHNDPALKDDKVSFSYEAKKLCTNNLLTGKQVTTSEIRVEDIESAFQESQMYIGKRLRHICADLEINPSTRIEFSCGSIGDIEVAKTFPESTRLEMTLSRDNVFTNKVRQASLQKGTLNRVNAHREFSKAYAEDPELAVEQYSHLFDEYPGNSARFSFEKGNLNIRGPIIA